MLIERNIMILRGSVQTIGKICLVLRLQHLSLETTKWTISSISNCISRVTYEGHSQVETSICPQAVSPLKGDCLHEGNVVGTHFRRHFRRKFWPQKKTEPLLLPFEGWPFTWYKYCPASTVPLREKCTEKWCP